MFSAILGLGASLIGASSANRRARSQAALAREQLDLSRQQQDFLESQSLLANEERQNENAYTRQMEQLNRLLAQQERQFQLDQMGQRQDTLSAERQFEIDRIVEADREAARLQAMQIEQLLRNTDLAAEERRYAEQQLEQAQQIASGEREEDLRRYYEEQAIQTQQREFLLDQFYGQRDALAADQQRDLETRDMLMGEITNMQDAIKQAELSLGPAPELETLTKADLDAEIARRQDQYQSDVDRAADRVASVNEANLIRAGIDASTPGTARRGDITRRVADEYQSARNRAYDEALSYITGQQDMNVRNYNTELQGREAALAEVLGVESAGLSELMSLPQVRSMAPAYSSAGQFLVGPYSRQITSANNYTSPVSMGSAIFDSFNVNPGMSTAIGASSAADNSFLNLESAITQPYGQNLLDQGTYTTAATRLGQQMLNYATTSSNNAQADAAGAWGGFGRQLADSAQDGLFDGLFNEGSRWRSDYEAPTTTSGNAAGTGLW